MCCELGSADVANKKSLGNDQCSQNSGVQVLKADNKEISLGNSCGNLDLRNEESEGGVPVLSASKKKKLHWGYKSNSTLIKRKMRQSFSILFIMNSDLMQPFSLLAVDNNPELLNENQITSSLHFKFNL